MTPSLLLVTILALSPAAGAQPPGGSPPAVSGQPLSVEAGARVLGVELQLPPGADAKGLSELVSVRRHQPLSPREVRRTLERLWGTGRFSDLEVRGIPEREGVRVVFVLTPAAVIVGAAVEGNVAIGDRVLLEEARFVGEARESALEQLPEAAARVQRLYAQRGYEAARVRASAVKVATGVELLLEVEEGAPTRVAKVSVVGASAMPQAELQTALGLAPGAILDRARLAEGLARLGSVLREAGYRTARVDPPREERQGAEVSLVVEVRAGPRWGLRFSGNRLLPSSVLKRVVGELVADPEDLAAVESAAARLEEYYRFRGFLEAEVSVRQHRAPDGERALLVFDIREDLPWLVHEIRFDGREAIPEAELRALLLEQLRSKVPQVEGARAPLAEPLELEGRAPEGHQRIALLPDAGSVFVEEAWRESAEQLTQLYRGRGHLAARVELASVTLDPVRRTVSVRFGVEEGPQARVETVELEGLPTEVARESLQLPPSQTPFSPALGERVRAMLDAALARNGYVFAQVEGRASLSEDGTRALLRYEVEPGPRVHVGKVVLKGLDRTDPELVRGQLSLVEGSPLDPEQLRVTQRNLSLLGHFRQVTVRPVAPEVREPVKDVVVEVRERARAEGQVAVGYFVAEGPRLLLEADFPNLFKSGFTLQSRLRGNYVALSLVDSLRALEGLEAFGGQGSVSLVSPRVATPVGQFGTQVDAIAERVFRPAFTFNRLAGVLGADVVNGWFSVALQGELELDDVDTLGSNEMLRLLESYVDPVRVSFPNGRFALWATRLTATGDFRDDPANTRSGALVSVSAELMDDFFATFRKADGRSREGSLNSLKLSANVTGYLPLGKRTVLAASLRGGDIHLLRPDAETIAPRRFFLGGWASMRGFREDGVLPADLRTVYEAQRNACRALATQAGCTAAAQLLEGGSDLRSEGGNRFVLGKLELRLPLFSALDLGIFGEAGNLWLTSPQKWSEFELRYVAGAGLRLRTPVGPVAFDVGLNLTPDREVNEQPASMHFSIGLF